MQYGNVDCCFGIIAVLTFVLINVVTDDVGVTYMVGLYLQTSTGQWSFAFCLHILWNSLPAVHMITSHVTI